MLHLLIAYDAQGNVVATLDHMVAKDDDGNVIGLVDFAAHEDAGGRLRDIWENSAAVGSGTWPEWLKGGAHDFKVELDPNPGPARARIKALVHKKSGFRRERSSIEAAIAERQNDAKMAAKKKGDAIRQDLRLRGMKPEDVALVDDPAPVVDLRDLLGGPQRPLLLDDDGRNRPRVKSERPNLPVVQRAPDRPRKP